MPSSGNASCKVQGPHTTKYIFKIRLAVILGNAFKVCLTMILGSVSNIFDT